MDKYMVENLQMKKLNLSHLNQMLALQKIVHDSIAEPSLCMKLNEKEMAELLVNDTGLTVGLFDGGKMIGFHAALIPGRRKDNLGYDLNLRDDVLKSIFHLEICLIHPNYCGKALQTKMSRWLVGQFQKRERFRYLCQTASPHNIASVKNTLAIGALIVQLKAMYGGFERYIFFQDIKTPFTVDTTTKLEVSLKDKHIQQQLLAEGFVGYELNKKDGELMLSLAKLKTGTIPYKFKY